MKKIRIYFFIMCLAFSLNAFNQTITWNRKSNIPIPLSKAKAAAVKEKIYIMGGITPSTNGFSTANFEYDPQTDKWTKKKELPTIRANYAMAVIDTKIYLIGGDPFSDNVEVYDTESDKWETLREMPSQRQHINCAVLNNKIYVIGGLENLCCPPFPERCDWEKCTIISNKNQVYDPKTNEWQDLSPLPTPRHGLDMVATNGKIFVIGGMGDSTSMWNPQKTVEVYDPILDKWSLKHPMKSPRDGYAYYLQDNKIFLLGGWVSDNIQTDSISIYNPIRDTWATQKMPFKTGSCAFATVDSKIYIFGGDREDYSEIYSFTYVGTIQK